MPDDQILAQAEKVFREGIEAQAAPTTARERFAAAAAGYEELRRRGYQSAALFRNQGNAYLLSGDVPRAVLAFRRGLWLASGDRAMRSSLDYIRGQLASPYSVRSWRPLWLPRPAPSWLSGVAIGFYSASWLALTRWWIVGGAWWLRAGLGCFLIAAVPAVDLGMQAWDRQEEIEHPAVVIANDGVKLRRGNGASYPVVADIVLPRGTEARWLYTRGDWLQIELARGRVGWVSRAGALVDETQGN
jgi:hypothetical protein